MPNSNKKWQNLERRRKRVRRKVFGTTERPRLSVSRSLRHIRAQIINDETGTTLAAACTLDKEVADGIEGTGNIAAAKAVGTIIGQRAVAVGVTSVVFDRGGRPYHGRIAALAEGAREAGLQF